MYFAKRLTEQVGGAQIWLKRCVGVSVLLVFMVL
jgi:hypothetical protein